MIRFWNGMEFSTPDDAMEYAKLAEQQFFQDYTVSPDTLVKLWLNGATCGPRYDVVNSRVANCAVRAIMYRLAALEAMTQESDAAKATTP